MSLIDTVIYGDVTLRNILVFLILMTVTVVLAKLITMALKRALIDKIKRNLLDMILKIIYYTIIIVVFIGSTPLLGINLSGLLLAGGITGIIIGFALQNVVANLVSGIFLAIERPVRIGDGISLGSVTGVVEDVNIFSTIIRTYDGLFVRVPNSTVFTSNITNYTAHVARRFEYVIGISYGDDAKKAIEVIKKVIEEHPLALKRPEPQVFVDNLGESSVNIIIRVWAPSQEWYTVKMDLLWEIKRKLEENGISIPFPQRVVWFANNLRLENKNTDKT
ncbi:MAG: mechanosensitive ion channel family protein [Zestosphaera sp.]